MLEAVDWANGFMRATRAAQDRWQLSQPDHPFLPYIQPFVVLSEQIKPHAPELTPEQETDLAVVMFHAVKHFAAYWRENPPQRAMPVTWH